MTRNATKPAATFTQRKHGDWYTFQPTGHGTVRITTNVGASPFSTAAETSFNLPTEGARDLWRANQRDGFRGPRDNHSDTVIAARETY